ncbi:MAG: SDR family NAD(P)-dependent oxidoreductase [Candidatus Binataceae bacterium]
MAFKDRTALNTGGSRGIGKGIAQGLASEGVRVVISNRNGFNFDPEGLPAS